jgi:hypothetical protein
MIICGDNRLGQSDSFSGSLGRKRLPFHVRNWHQLPYTTIFCQILPWQGRLLLVPSTSLCTTPLISQITDQKIPEFLRTLVCNMHGHFSGVMESRELASEAIRNLAAICSVTGQTNSKLRTITHTSTVSTSKSNLSNKPRRNYTRETHKTSFFKRTQRSSAISGERVSVVPTSKLRSILVRWRKSGPLGQ